MGKNKSIPFFLLYAGLLAGLYFSSFAYLARMWQLDDYNYCYLVPLVVLYLIWEQRSRLAAVRTSSSWGGLVFIGFGIVSALNKISVRLPIIFPVHPRTRKMIDLYGLELAAGIHQLPPLGFRESLFWWRDAVMVLTDSGGLQEETTALRIPCITAA